MHCYDSSKNYTIEGVFMFVALLCLWVPNSYSYLFSGYTYATIRWLQYGFAGIFFVFVLVTKRYNKMFWVVFMLACILLFSTVVNRGSVAKCLNYIAPLMGTVSMITYYFSCGRARQLLAVMRYLLYIYITLNIITCFAYPEGLYETELRYSSEAIVNTYLGNRNAYKYYGFLLIAVSYIEGVLIEKDGRSKKEIVLGAIILSLLMEIIGGSLTGIITVSMMSLYYIVGTLGLEIEFVRPKFVFLLGAGIFMFLILFVSFGKFTSLISYLFRGNVTFSNRLSIWKAAFKAIKKYPILGMGTQTSDNIYRVLNNVHAHNHYLEIALRGGVTAIAAFIGSVWLAVKKLDLFRDKVMVSFLSVCIFCVMIIDMMEVETYSFAVLSYLCAMIYCLGISIKDRMLMRIE